MFPPLPPYQPDDYTPSEYKQRQTDINTSYYPQTIEESTPLYSAELQGEPERVRSALPTTVIV